MRLLAVQKSLCLIKWRYKINRSYRLIIKLGDSVVSPSLSMLHGHVPLLHLNSSYCTVFNAKHKKNICTIQDKAVL